LLADALQTSHHHIGLPLPLSHSPCLKIKATYRNALPPRVERRKA
jgi:hypothetical protein